jgi:hypothetical protein
MRGRSRKDALAAYATDNAEAARIILDHPGRYGGEDSLMVRWARLWLKNHLSWQAGPPTPKICSVAGAPASSGASDV